MADGFKPQLSDLLDNEDMNKLGYFYDGYMYQKINLGIQLGIYGEFKDAGKMVIPTAVLEKVFNESGLGESIYFAGDDFTKEMIEGGVIVGLGNLGAKIGYYMPTRVQSEDQSKYIINNTLDGTNLVSNITYVNRFYSGLGTQFFENRNKTEEDYSEDYLQSLVDTMSEFGGIKVDAGIYFGGSRDPFMGVAIKDYVVQPAVLTNLIEESINTVLINGKTPESSVSTSTYTLVSNTEEIVKSLDTKVSAFITLPIILDFTGYGEYNIDQKAISKYGVVAQGSLFWLLPFSAGYEYELVDATHEWHTAAMGLGFDIHFAEGLVEFGFKGSSIEDLMNKNGFYMKGTIAVGL